MKCSFRTILLLLFLLASCINLVSGKCIKQHGCGPCRRHWDPICGSDGVTYSNSCILNCARRTCSPDLHAVHKGSCDSQEDEYLDYEYIEDREDGNSLEDDDEDPDAAAADDDELDDGGNNSQSDESEEDDNESK